MPITTIQLEARTRKKLAGLKSNPRESYDQVINRLMQLIPEGDEDGPYAAKFRASLLQSQLESAAGLSIEHADAMRMLGLDAAGKPVGSRKRTRAARPS